MRKVLAFIGIGIITTLWASVGYADLLARYKANTSIHDRSRASFQFGVNTPVIRDFGGGNVTFLEAGAETDAKRGCGLLTDMTANLRGLFDKEALLQGATGMAQNVISAAPSTLMCYASQTLCDKYKFMRNMANFRGQMNQMSCEQLEAAGMQLVDSKRKRAVQECAMEKARTRGSSNFSQFIQECEGNARNLPVRMMGTNERRQGGYNLSEVMARQFSNDPETQRTLTRMFGDVRFSAEGVHGQGVPQMAEEQMLNEYTKKYFDATKETIESYINDNRMPDTNTLRAISTPGFPITPRFVQRIAFMEPNSRLSFYEQYATVAGMNATLIRITELVDRLETLKQVDGQNDVEREKLERMINRLERKYGLIERRIMLQKNLLSPMFLAVMQYDKPMPRAATPPRQERDLQIPTPIWQRTR